MGYADARLYDQRTSATEAEIEYLRGLGTHLIGTETHNHSIGQTGDRLRLLMNYLESLDRKGRGQRDLGKINGDTIRDVVVGMIAQETEAVGTFVPRNGHGLYGSRQYARPRSSRRTE